MLILFFTNCSLTKKVTDKQLVLVGNELKFEGDEKPLKGSALNYVKQKPNNKVLGFVPLEVGLYNLAPKKFDEAFEEYYRNSQETRNLKLLDSILKKYDLEKYVGKSLWLKRLGYNLGKPPVILDSSQIFKSNQNLATYYGNNGYFDAEAQSKIIKKGKKKAKIQYIVTPGKPSILETFDYEIKNPKLKELYESILMESLIETQERFALSNFEGEENRVSTYFKNNGYYNFNGNGQELYFEVDTIPSDKRLDVKLFVNKADGDSTNFKQFYWNKVTIYPDTPFKDTSIKYYTREHKNFVLKFKNPPTHRLDYFTDAMGIQPYSLYRLQDVVQTNKNLYQRENFNFNDYNEIVADDEKGLLDAEIFLSPKPKYDFSVGFEGSFSEYLGFGVSPRTSLLTRNIFGGGENFELSFRSTFGTVTNDDLSQKTKLFNAFDMSVNLKLKFPYLFLPFGWGDKLSPERYSPSTDLRVGFSGQRNVGLGRINYIAGMDYNLSPAKEHNHRLTLFNTQYVRNTDKDRYFQIFSQDRFIRDAGVDLYFAYNSQIQNDFEAGLISEDVLFFIINNDQEFLNALNGTELQTITQFQNMTFRKETITQDALITSFIYQYTYNQTLNNRKVNPWFFRGQLELAGNTLSVLDNLIGFNSTATNTGDRSSTIFGVPYSQFLKFDLDFRRYFTLNQKSKLAARMFLGLALPYGNTDFIPFDRSYFGGGSTDIRAWQAYELGPGDNNSVGNFRISNFKLTWNVEYRFDIFGALEGALFTDMGNIWSVNNVLSLNAFKFRDFYKEIAIGSGFGARYNFGYGILLRLDFAYQLRDPAFSLGNRWRFKDFNPLKFQFQFGINHAF